MRPRWITPVYPCCICGEKPALRKVGRLGFCKKHIEEATATRTDAAAYYDNHWTHDQKIAYSSAKRILRHVNKGKPRGSK